MRQKGFAPVIVLVFLVIISGIYFLGKDKKNITSNPNSSPISSSIPTPIIPTNEPVSKPTTQSVDEFEKIRNSVNGKIDGEMTTNYLIGKKFMNFCMSGQWGTFNKDGTITLNWGRDYAGPNDTRPTSGIGKWEINDDKLTISESTLSGGVYDNFYFYQYQGQVFAVPESAWCGMYIGNDFTQITNFYEAVFRPFFKH